MTQTLITIYIFLCLAIGLFNIVYIIINNVENTFDIVKGKIVLDIENESNINDDYFFKHLKNIKVLKKFSSFLNEYDSKYDFEKYLNLKSDLIYKLLVYYSKNSEVHFIFLINMLSKYKVINEDIINLLYKCLDKSIYLRYEAFSYICRCSNIKYILSSLKIICKNNIYFNKKVIVENLNLCNDKHLSKALLENFDNFCENIKLSIIDYLRINKILAKNKMLSILKNNYSDEVKYSTIRYFGVIKSNDAKDVMLDLLKNDDEKSSIVISKALANYKDEDVIKVLMKNINNKNFYIRINSIKSLKKLLNKSEFSKLKGNNNEINYYLNENRGEKYV